MLAKGLKVLGVVILVASIGCIAARASDGTKGINAVDLLSGASVSKLEFGLYRLDQANKSVWAPAFLNKIEGEYSSATRLAHDSAGVNYNPETGEISIVMWLKGEPSIDYCTVAVSVYRSVVTNGSNKPAKCCTQEFSEGLHFFVNYFDQPNYTVGASRPLLGVDYESFGKRFRYRLGISPTGSIFDEDALTCEAS